MSIENCPVCKSSQLDAINPDYDGACITSDMMVLPTSTLRNRLCVECGLIFNAGGPRGGTDEFYRDSYNLMMRDKNSAIQSFAGPQSMSQAERTFVILRELVDLPTRGVLVEAGAGKGEFLEHFRMGLPDWKVNAFEPSDAFAILRERFPDGLVEKCDYRTFLPPTEQCDLVVALGVLEHVENPLDMLKWGNALLRNGGVFYIRVPHFSNNPSDLFCADHLSKLTYESLQSLAHSSGFEVAGHKEAGVPIFLALRKSDELADRPTSATDSNRKVARHNAEVARSMMEVILKGRRVAVEAGERFAIFGLGAAGLFAPLFAPFPAGDIAVYLDENRSLWGGQIHGRPIGGLDLIEREGIRHVALAVSPVYVEQIAAKLRPFGVTVYTA